MYRDHRIGVVIPAYNEAEFVGETIETVPSFSDRVYAIDDGSTDSTWEEIERRAHFENHGFASDKKREDEPNRRVVPIRHETNRGVGGAIKTGYRRAYEDGMDVVVVIAGDGQMDPDDLGRLLDPIVEGEADYAKGTRFCERSYRNGMSTFRVAGTVVLTGLTRVASGYWDLSDPQNGYTAISREALDAISVDDLYDRYGFCNDLLIRLGAHDLSVVDVPTAINYGDEESHIRYRSFVPNLLVLFVRRFLWRLGVKLSRRRRSADTGHDTEVDSTLRHNP